MKLQKLTIHNIASIEDATIDFEAQPLADSELFLITGKTGAGKSTILDAICLALFADTPRLEDTKMQGETKDVDNKIGIDDPRQLMRRNTGEAFVSLTFTGSNNVHYEAVWKVWRSRNKPTGNLQGKSWSLKNIDIDYTYEKDAEIRPEIKAAIGLDFKQFCRTTLLAQGEFTRFLNSKDEEKAAILEKITGVDIYTKVGKKVYELTAYKEQLWKEAQRLVEGTRTMTEDEIATKKEEVAAFDILYNNVKAACDEDKAKLQWIKDEAELTKAVSVATEEHRQAQKEVEGDDFNEKELLVRQWNATIDARQWLTAKKNAEYNKVLQQKTLSALESDFVEVLGGFAFAEQERQKTEADIKNITKLIESEKDKVAEAQKAFDTQNAEVKTQEEAFVALHLNELRKQRDDAKELMRNITTTYERIESHAAEKERKAMAARALEEAKAEIEKKQKEAKQMEPFIHDAKVKMDVCKEMLEKQSDTINKFAKTLRQKLHIGDVCPVCRQEIKSQLPHEEQLARLVDTLKHAYTDAESAHKKLVDEKNRIDADIRSSTRAYLTAKEAFDKDKSVDTAAQKVVAACKACGITTIDKETPLVLKSLDEKTKATLKVLEAKILEGEEKDNANKELRSVLEKLRQNLEQLKDTHQKNIYRKQTLEAQLTEMATTGTIVKDVIQHILLLIPSWKNPAATAPLTFPPKQSALLKKANDVKSKASAALIQLKQSEDADNLNTRQIETFIHSHQHISIERLTTLNHYTSQTIAETTNLLQSLRNNVLTKKTLMEEYVRKAEHHRLATPKLKQQDTTDTLRASIAHHENTLAQISEKKGAINHQLKADQEKKKQHAHLIQDADKKRDHYQKYSRLSHLIGDATGNKFRKIAQSYLLSTLIHTANTYMKTLTDRYTLTVTPGTFPISIQDAYQGYISRAANTISGGESFLVSLALALALSDISQQLAVDTLFIDEGFGTLSGEPLQNAINTLRSLHNKTRRHVGIISHMEELQQQIPIQIQVLQEGNNSSSKVKIVSL